MYLLDLLASFRATRPAGRSRSCSATTARCAPRSPPSASRATSCPCRNVAGLGDAGPRGVAAAAARAGGPGAGAAGSRRRPTLRKLRRRLRAESARRGPDERHEGARPRHLGRPARRARRLAPSRLRRIRAVMARLLRWSARPGVAGVAVSRSVADDATRVLGPGARRDGLQRDRPRPLLAGPGDGAGLDAARACPPRPAGTVRVGLVATFARWKGHDVFLDAVALVPADAPGRFYVVGGPLYRSAGSQYRLDELRARRRRRGCRPRRVRRPPGRPGRRSSGPSTSWSTRAPGPSRSAG